jgi:transposase
MNAYSEDLRKKTVEAKQRGTPTVEVARTFGVGLSSVKRYAKTAREGGLLRPKRSPGRPPKADERARRLLEEALGGGSRGTSCRHHPLREARVPARLSRAEGERVHRL